MPSMPPPPIRKMPSKHPRLEAFLKRNIVVIAICAPLLVVAVIAAICGH